MLRHVRRSVVATFCVLLPLDVRGSMEKPERKSMTSSLKWDCHMGGYAHRGCLNLMAGTYTTTCDLEGIIARVVASYH